MKQSLFEFDYQTEQAEREIQIVVERDRQVIPRPYQDKAADCVYSHWSRGEKRVLVEMATGLGKSVLFSEIMRRWKEQAA